jgi:hypothetical protein
LRSAPSFGIHALACLSLSFELQLVRSTLKSGYRKQLTVTISDYGVLVHGMTSQLLTVNSWKTERARSDKISRRSA